jgi:hypothetical protein
VDRIWKTRNVYRYLFKNGNLEHRGEGGRIILRWLFDKQVVIGRRMEFTVV